MVFSSPKNLCDFDTLHFAVDRLFVLPLPVLFLILKR